MQAYKGTDANGRCQGFQYEVGKDYKIDGRVELCARGSQSKQGWIVIVDWRQNKTRDWFIKRIYNAKVGGRIKGIKIREGTWYWFEDGKLRS